MIQSLGKTVGLANDAIIELDTMRKQRNIADYSGDLIMDSSMQACLGHADALWNLVNNYLAEN